jgi:hypothetical protein
MRKPPVAESRLPIIILILLIGVIEAACSDAPLSPRNISSPVPAPLRTEVEAPVEVFSGTTQPTWTQNVAIPDSVWVLVQAEGLVSYSRNPLCYTPAYKGFCDGTPGPLETGGPWGPVEAPASARVSVQRVGGPHPIDNFSSGSSMYSPTGTTKSAVGRFLFRNVSGPGYLWTKRDVLQTWAGNPTSPSGAPYIPVFVTSGEQNVSIQFVPTPLRIAGPTTVEPGDTVTFAAEPVGDFRIRDGQGRRGVFWQFLPGDTLDQHNPGSPREDVPCDSALCEYAPFTSGRLVASTYIEGQPLSVASSVIRLDSAKLELTCMPLTVERGSDVSCRVRAGSGALTNIRWQFTDSAGHVIAGPEGATRWGGRMVIGGMMNVTAELNGLQTSADTSIAVRARAWTSPVPQRREIYMKCATLSSTCFQLYPPTHHRHLGSTIFQPRGVRLFDRATSITDGPNAGWSYLNGTESPARFDEQVIILNDLLNPANNDAVATAWWAERPQCDRATVREGVLSHERHHADLYDRNRRLVDEDLERTIAFVTEPVWREMLGPSGSEAARIATRVHQISGGRHLATDGFPRPVACDLELLSNHQP